MSLYFSPSGEVKCLLLQADVSNTAFYAAGESRLTLIRSAFFMACAIS